MQRTARSLAATLAATLCLGASLARPAPAHAELRGGAFEIAGVGGVGTWGPKVGLKPCAWFGGMAGHRFPAQAERLHLGFRAGWEGCIAQQQRTQARIDMIYVDVGFTYGVRALDWLLFYALTGAGFVLADSTPSGGTLYPRTAFQGGGGLTISLGPYVFLDAGVRVLVFENIQFGGFAGQPGSTFNPILALSLGGQV